MRKFFILTLVSLMPLFAFSQNVAKEQDDAREPANTAPQSYQYADNDEVQSDNSLNMKSNGDSKNEEMMNNQLCEPKTKTDVKRSLSPLQSTDSKSPKRRKGSGFFIQGGIGTSFHRF